jgi:hypothetical protein
MIMSVYSHCMYARTQLHTPIESRWKSWSQSSRSSLPTRATPCDKFGSTKACENATSEVHLAQLHTLAGIFRLSCFDRPMYAFRMRCAKVPIQIDRSRRLVKIAAGRRQWLWRAQGLFPFIFGFKSTLFLHSWMHITRNNNTASWLVLHTILFRPNVTTRALSQPPLVPHLHP